MEGLIWLRGLAMGSIGDEHRMGGTSPDENPKVPVVGGKEIGCVIWTLEIVSYVG
jgi:hypothetical protein